MAPDSERPPRPESNTSTAKNEDRHLPPAADAAEITLEQRNLNNDHLALTTPAPAAAPLRHARRARWLRHHTRPESTPARYKKRIARVNDLAAGSWTQPAKPQASNIYAGMTQRQASWTQAPTPQASNSTKQTGNTRLQSPQLVGALHQLAQDARVALRVSVGSMMRLLGGTPTCSRRTVTLEGSQQCLGNKAGMGTQTLKLKRARF